MQKTSVKKSNDTRERLLETAIELICKSSYDTVGVKEICEKSGITKGAFYHYFDSKATLFCEATNHHWEIMKAELNAIYSPEHTALEQLEGLLEFIIIKQERFRYDDNPVSGCPFFASATQTSAENTKILHAARDMAEKAIRYNVTLVRNLKAEGRLASNADEMQTAELLYQFIQGLLLYGRVFGDLQHVKQNLRPGVYRLLDLKPDYWHQSL